MMQRSLTIKDIVEAFPEECKTILPREIKRLKKLTRAYEDDVKILTLRHYGRFEEWFAIEILKLQHGFYPAWHSPTTPWSILKHLQSVQDHFLNPPADNPNRVSEDQIARAKQRPIIELYSFEKVKRSGGRIYAICPFHTERSSSFVIYANNSAHCFGCQVSFQDPIAFVMHPQIQGLSFPQAVRYLAGV